MKTRSKHLGCEKLETRLNLSAAATIVAVQALGTPLLTDAARPRAPHVMTVVADFRHPPLRRVRPSDRLVALPGSPNQTVVPVQPAAPATTTTDSGGNTVSPNQQVLPGLSNPLDPILAKLYGDDAHDDTATIQQLVDVANVDGIKSITLPAGTFLLKHEINFYGTDITLSGQGDKTILDVDNHFGSGNNSLGRAMSIMASLDSTPMMISQAVTGNTIVFRGKMNVQAGETLFLSNGRGSTMIIEKNLAGPLAAATYFNELGPDEFVRIAAVATDANGNTVATLAQNVVGTKDYFNVAPVDAASDKYLHAQAVDKPADHLTVENFDIEFKDMAADSALSFTYSDYATAKNIKILNVSTAGSRGAIWAIGSSNGMFQDITSPAPVELNSCRFMTVENNTVAGVFLEEASTDNIISKNDLTGATGADLRTNDMACQRNLFDSNNIHGGAYDTGAIAIFEGVDNTVSHNTVHDGRAWIWLGTTKGSKVIDNTAALFNNFQPLDASTIQGNSWQ